MGCPIELYEDRKVVTQDLLYRHSKGWTYCLSGSAARAKLLPAAFDTTLVASVPVQLSGERDRWLLKCVAVTSPHAELAMDPDGKPEHP